MKTENSLNIKTYYLYFMMYAIVGWLYEVILEVFVYKWGFSNRGVLFGPYCPIYGVGALSFIFCLKRIIKIKSSGLYKFIKPFIIFAGCMLIATAIELVTSYILEYISGSWPWQTYSKYGINFQARIALSPSIRFGIGGVIFIYALQPLFEKLVAKMSQRVLNIVFYSVLTLFLFDLGYLLYRELRKITMF
ncbi:MAG: putative ABC transporter permease [Spirochaetes bacterium]|nr:putative ABC transporter permease [Spirochaetota bacterium]MBN2769248.1 putative ABC transporter permease [Spirochaetota bacterium]